MIKRNKWIWSIYLKPEIKPILDIIGEDFWSLDDITMDCIVEQVVGEYLEMNNLKGDGK